MHRSLCLVTVPGVTKCCGTSWADTGFRGVGSLWAETAKLQQGPESWVSP